MAEERHPYLPEQDYADPNVISTYDFIYLVQDYASFLSEYIDHLYDPDDSDSSSDNGYYESFIDICERINTDEGDNGTFETYRATLEPFMEFMTQECVNMNAYEEEEERNTREFITQQNFVPYTVPKEFASAVAASFGPKGVASRTRSKATATRFEIPQVKKRRRDPVTLSQIKEGPVIKLSDKREYTQGELKNMWDWNKTITPYRHPYTQEDKQTISELLGFAKGLKKNTRKARKARKAKKARKTKKQKKSKKTRKAKNKH
jgi:uncharacterized protein YlaI